MSRESDPGSPVPLPVHPIPELPEVDTWEIVVREGDHSIRLDAAAVAALPHVDVVDQFTCLEGWTAGPLRWGGVRLSTLLQALEGVGSGYVAVSAGEFCSVMPGNSLPAETLLADTLDGRPLAREHGGPFRLVVPGGVCYQSVKWVQRIEVQDSPIGDTAHKIARSRLDTQKE